MGNKRTPISTEIRRRWGDLAQVAFLDALMAHSGFAPDELSFHGGTSLHLCWSSPRYSEDLDFMTSHADAYNQLEKSMPKIRARMERFLAAHEPGLSVEIKDKTKADNVDRMVVFDALMSHTDVIGKARVRTEFWHVTPEYLSLYEDNLRLPSVMADKDLLNLIESSMPVPTASKESILADKLVAIAYRNYIKWRDMFDIWWLDQRMATEQAPLFALGGANDKGHLVERAIRHAMAYDGPGLENGLQAFLDRRDELVEGKDCNLDRFLPQELVDALVPNRVPEMVNTALLYAKSALAHIQTLNDDFLIEYEPAIKGDKKSSRATSSRDEAPTS